MPSEFCITPFLEELRIDQVIKLAHLLFHIPQNETTMCGQVPNIWSEFVNA